MTIYTEIPAQGSEPQESLIQTERHHRPSVVPGILAVVFSGAIFGFFFAWVCSTMWGLDSADPRVAIEAMQAMNGSVRNATFAPAFFGTPFVLLGASLFARHHRLRNAAMSFGAAAAMYFFGGLVLTIAANVPMNEELALVIVPESREAAAKIWADYSETWQAWNIARTIFSGISLALAARGVALMGHPKQTPKTFPTVGHTG